MELVEIFDGTWLIFIERFFMNLLIIVVISRYFYYSKGRGTREYMFTYITTSMVIFLVCILISKVKVELGIALGLFAVFSVIRFRSVQATARELAYLFICLGFSLMFALLPLDTPFLRVLVNSLLILGTIGLTDYLVYRNNLVEKVVNYDRPELLAGERSAELRADLETRFGITGISSIQAGNIDTLKNRVRLKIWIRDTDNKHYQEK